MEREEPPEPDHERIRDLQRRLCSALIDHVKSNPDTSLGELAADMVVGSICLAAGLARLMHQERQHWLMELAYFADTADPAWLKFIFNEKFLRLIATEDRSALDDDS